MPKSVDQRSHITLSLVAVLLLAGSVLHAQEKRLDRILIKPDSEYMVYKKRKDTVIPARDLFDVFNSIFHKNNPKVIKKATITPKPIFSFIPAVGYALSSRFAGSLTGNIAYRVDTNTRVSTITTAIEYTQNKQFEFPIESNIWTKNNIFDFVGDWRFYKYPQSTFGLGSNSSIQDEDPMDYIYFRFHESVLRNIVGNLFLGAGYIVDYHGDISHKGTLDGAPSDFVAYGADGHTISSGITADVLYDSRDNSIYAERGTYALLEYRDNFEFLGSTEDWQSIIIDLRKYFRFPAGTDNVIAFRNYDWLIIDGKPPYLDLPSTGWDPYVTVGRGYIQGRFRGAQEIYGETEYRFKLTSNGLFGGVVFANAQSFSAAPGTKLESIQPGYGAGVRIKLNKLTKTNIAVDYGFGNQGSRGLFVNIGELF